MNVYTINAKHQLPVINLASYIYYVAVLFETNYKFPHQCFYLYDSVIKNTKMTINLALVKTCMWVRKAD